jgi:hypothetical protein
VSKVTDPLGHLVRLSAQVLSHVSVRRSDTVGLDGVAEDKIEIADSVLVRRVIAVFQLLADGLGIHRMTDRPSIDVVCHRLAEDRKDGCPISCCVNCIDIRPERGQIIRSATRSFNLARSLSTMKAVNSGS